MISVSKKEWSERKFNTNLVDKLSQDNNFSQILSKLIISRNFNDEEVHSIKHLKNINFSNVFKFNEDYKKSIDLVVKCVKNKETICIFGDYDVDGASSTALLTRYFLSINQKVQTYIPDRQKEGYGPNIDGFNFLIHQGAKIIFTVDCGTLSFSPIKFAQNQDIDVIVLDHHQSDSKLPNACAIVNPNRYDDASDLTYLCASGVCFIFLIALNKKLRDEDWFNKIKLMNLTF